ncbi:MAG: Stk1 family PASTA domain-containing Ser/Thr kinase [Actinomycetales bacterium]|nr:Stk1 family PASTA domain-containing Ser/Thr kinase [Actinomycetales bacterium]
MTGSGTAPAIATPRSGSSLVWPLRRSRRQASPSCASRAAARNGSRRCGWRGNRVPCKGLPRLPRVEVTGQSGLVGTTVDGRYRIVSQLARGGMAVVYEALDLRLDRVVALKVMHPHLAHDQGFVTRFQREAKAAARLTHGHVVAVYDQGSDGDLVYLAMEYVPGRTLRDVLREYGPLTPEQALVFLDPVLEALAAAHAAGFVHRDIKPENVLISDDGRVKVADFGLARAMETDGQSVTQGMIIGTVAYLSPEQVERGEADGRSDLYAAGILLFEMITGQVPHAGESPLSVAYQHVNSDVPAPSTVNSAILPEVDALVVTATRRDPSLRYQNAFDFLADVRRVRSTLPPPRPFVDAQDTLIVDVGMASELAAGRPTAAVTAGPAASAGASATPRQQPGERPTRPTALSQPPTYRRSRAPWVVVLVALAVLATAFGAWYLAAGPGRTVPTPDVIGADVTDATAQMTAAGLTLAVATEEFSEDVPAGEVISTDPAPGDGIRSEGTVSATVSKGPERYDVPSLKGLTQTEAADAIVAANLALGSITEAYDDKAPLGTVVSSTPKAGTPSKSGTSVDLVVSKGPEPVPVPDIVGKKLAGAKATLSDAGLKADVTQKYSMDVKDGSVISVKPKPGTIVDSGSKVTVVVSKGPPPVTVPNLIDMPKQKAITTLQRLGLRPKVVQGAFSPLNRVISQDPAGGTQIPKGSTVTIRII